MSETEKSEEKKEVPASPQKAWFSIVGLLVVAALVFYGMPHVSSALKNVTGRLNSENPEPDVDKITEEVVMESPVADKDEPILEKKEEAGFVVNHTKLQQEVANAIESALRKEFREGTRFLMSEDARYSESLNEVRALYEIDENSYEMTFKYDPHFEEFKAALDTEDLKKFFSRSPRFQLAKTK